MSIDGVQSTYTIRVSAAATGWLHCALVEKTGELAGCGVWQARSGLVSLRRG